MDPWDVSKNDSLLPFSCSGSDISDIENAYEKEQREKAKEVLDMILAEYDAAFKARKVSKFHVGFLFVPCKKDEQEFTLPVFALKVGVDSNGNDLRHFVDTLGRCYSSWSDWKDNNTLPMLK